MQILQEEPSRTVMDLYWGCILSSTQRSSF